MNSPTSDVDPPILPPPASRNAEADGDGELPGLPRLRTWRGVYLFVLACYVLYLILLTVLSRAFS